MAAPPPILKFIVPLPPSVNALYSGKDRRHKSDAYKKWEVMAAQHVLSFRVCENWRDTITHPVAVWYRHGVPVDRRSRDAENYCKAISDLLKHERVLEDDKLICMGAYAWQDDVQPGYTEVIIVPLSKMQIVLS